MRRLLSPLLALAVASPLLLPGCDPGDADDSSEMVEPVIVEECAEAAEPDAASDDDTAREAARLAAAEAAGTLEEHPDHMPDDGPWLRSYGAYVVDRDSGEVIVSKRADRPRTMASIAKLMGALAYLSTEPDLDAEITITRQDVYSPTFTKSPLQTHSRYRAEDLLWHALLESDNRAIAALARSTGLSAEEFGALMNEIAADLGLVHSTFVEPTGINGDNRTTPYEAGVLLEAALAHPLLGEIIGHERHEFPRLDRNRTHVAHSSNMLMRMDHWKVVGSKTGYTCLAGSCLVMVAEVEGRNLRMSFMGHPDLEMRFNDAGEIRWWLVEQAGGKTPW